MEWLIAVRVALVNAVALVRNSRQIELGAATQRSALRRDDAGISLSRDPVAVAGLKSGETAV